MYQVHELRVRKEDEHKVNDILMRYYAHGDLDDFEIEVWQPRTRRNNGVILLRIRPLIYEDFEAIVDEFKHLGIHII